LLRSQDDLDWIRRSWLRRS